MNSLAVIVLVIATWSPGDKSPDVDILPMPSLAACVIASGDFGDAVAQVNLDAGPGFKTEYDAHCEVMLGGEQDGA